MQVCPKCAGPVELAVHVGDVRRYHCSICSLQRVTIEVEPELIYNLQARLFKAEYEGIQCGLRVGELELLVTQS